MSLAKGQTELSVLQKIAAMLVSRGVFARSYWFKLALDIYLLADWVFGRHKLGIH